MDELIRLGPAVSGLDVSAVDRKLVKSAPTAEIKQQITIKNIDMSEEMKNEAIDVVLEAFDKCLVEKDVAEHVKKEFDKRHGVTWHCIVGANFGSYVTHETNNFIYFYLDRKAVLLFKSG